MSTLPTTTLREAIISDCGRFRYRLSRDWDSDKPRLCFVMLNPSTADGRVDDATVRKCYGFASRLGFGGFDVVNLFAYRATKPADLRRAGSPEGPDNGMHQESCIKAAKMVICAWGNYDQATVAARLLLQKMEQWKVTSFALRINQGGAPAHPLMLPYASPPIGMAVAPGLPE